MNFGRYATDWMFSNNVDKRQRRLNSFVKAVNKNIKEDDLWLGRFVARQIKRKVQRDNGYVDVEFTLRFYDLQNKKYVDFVGSAADWCFPGNGYGLWRTMNDFIVEKCKAWESKPAPKAGETIDYTKFSTPQLDRLLKDCKPLYDGDAWWKNLKSTVK